MSVSRLGPLVSTSVLHHSIRNPKAGMNLKLMEASWTMKGYEEFQKRHIPGSNYINLQDGVEPTPLQPRGIPNPLKAQHYLRNLGVKHDQSIVVYDRHNTMWAARAWWMLRYFGHADVSVLDGGFTKWQLDGYPLACGETPYQKNGDFTIRIDSNLIRTFNDMKEIAETGKSQVLDIRRPEYFNGEAPEPSPATVSALLDANQPAPGPMQQGHVPGAINVTESHLLDPDTKCFLDPEHIKLSFRDLGVTEEKPIVSMSYNGTKACLVPFAMRLVGYKDVAIYPGSWTEYSQKADPSIVAKAGDAQTTNSQPATGG